MIETKKEYILKTLKKRPIDAHKGDFGKLLIVAGSYGMAGAAVLTGMGALKSGAGLIKYAVSKELFTILQISVPEAMCITRDLKKMESSYNAMIIGPGLGNYREDANVMKELLKDYLGKIIIDADGLNNIVRYNLHDYLINTSADVVITPHLKEAQRLMETENNDRLWLAEKLAEKYNCVALVKGEGTLITTPKGDIYKNTTGNPAMATGGSGDVLAGIIGSLMAQGYNSIDAARIGAYIHGLAGDLAREALGETGVSAGDIARYVAFAFKELGF